MTSSSAKEEALGPEVGTWDHLEAFIGQRGTGKSTFMCQRALELAHQAHGAHVIGHSLGARLPDKLPDGTELPITYHKTLRTLQRGLSNKPDRWHILAPPPMRGVPKDTADDLLEFSVRLAEAIKVRAYRREHPFAMGDSYRFKYQGVRAHPIIILVDEGIAVEMAGGGRSNEDEKRWFKEFLYSLRHNHTAMLWSIQDANARSWQILGQATLLHVFHQKHQWARNAIAAAGATDEQMDEIEHLKKYEHVTIQVSAPIGEDVGTETPG